MRISGIPSTRPRDAGIAAKMEAVRVISDAIVSDSQVTLPNPTAARASEVAMEFDWTETIETHVRHWTVGFVQLHPTTVSSAGSGTFVQFGEVVGVLTAAHVLEALIPFGRIGLLCFTVRANQLQRIVMDMADTEHVQLGTSPWTLDGPDIAFLKLPDDLIGGLRARVSIANADKQRADVLAGDPEPTLRTEFVAGVVSQWTNAPVQSGATVSVIFNALSSAGRFVDKWSANGFDLLRFKTIPAPDFQPPTTYQGTSGGGAWRLFVTRHDDGHYSVIQRRLVGVAFWEDPQPHGLDLICHGTESVYDRLRDAVRAKWPQACLDDR
jgi:hypothetical protein